MAETKKNATGYDKYVNWKIFIFPVVLFFLILALPVPKGMMAVGIQYTIGPGAVVNHMTTKLFQKKSSDVEQWQLVVAQMMERNMRMGALDKARFMKRNAKWCKKYKIPVDAGNFKRAFTYVKDQVSPESYMALMKDSVELRKSGLAYDDLSDGDKAKADKGAWAIKVAVAMMVFVVLCFITECIPLPGVAFCIGLILVGCGLLDRTQVTQYYWSDAAWFIMGSLMFAAAFVKTGVDKRVCLLMFKKLAVPDVKRITLIFFLIITPLAAFISDHALAAMFLPIGMLLYQNSLTEEIPEDRELAKLLHSHGL